MITHTTRPSSSNKGARIAWDFLTGITPESPIKDMWYTRSMDDGVWIAKYDNNEYQELSIHSVNYWKIHGAPTNYADIIIKREKLRNVSVPK